MTLDRHRLGALGWTRVVWWSVTIVVSIDFCIAIAAAVLLILLAMIWTARDRMRHARHDLFEVVHRYGGWTAVALLIAHGCATRGDVGAAGRRGRRARRSTTTRPWATSSSSASWRAVRSS